MHGQKSRSLRSFLKLQGGVIVFSYTFLPFRSWAGLITRTLPEQTQNTTVNIRLP